MKNSIIIGMPRIIKGKGNTIRLEAEISWNVDGEEIKETIYYEVEKKWEEYLTSEFSDPFVLAMLEVGFENGLDIYYEAPMTEDLKYQLETYVIPVFVRNIKTLKSFKLAGPTKESYIHTENVAGTGFSAGVDSFYSVLKHLNSPYQSKRVTHLLLTVNGAAQTGINAEIDQAWFLEEMELFSKLASELNLELIGVNSNISLLNRYRKMFKGGDGIVTCSFVHALRKLFGTYYWASTYEAKVLEFRTDDPGYMEPFYLPYLSVNGLKFYHSGCEVNRMEKVEFIADNPVVQKGLTVCGYTNSCGKCPKCTRTMAELFSIGKLEKFSTIFPDTELYQKNLGKNLAREFAQDHAPFTTEIVDSFKKNGQAIPITTYLWKWLWFKPLFFFKKKFKMNKLIIKLYYEKGWSNRIGEGMPPDYVVNARISGERLEK